ncbi:MAG TPA: carboxypeptidase-like regulatory domain-containing protein [Candidatus Sulfotelmatobacter sp.]|nr:carboxypeptidase-like regulatory domain-containing protein [Candidatus Sulfotelmatobacter sp.]
MLADNGSLPDAPQPSQVNSPSQLNDPQQTGDGTISGTVLDVNQDVVQGAQVTLLRPSGSTVRTIQSGSDGQFVFTGVAPQLYKLTVTAPGMKTYTSAEIPVASGEAQIVPPITLAVSGGATSVTVNGNKEVLSKQQEQIAVHQRIVGVIPNFYSAYDWNAPPMLAKQKIQLGLRSVLDPVSFLSVAGIAGAEQYENIFPSYGSGFEGYGKRFSAALANHVSSTMLGRAVFPAIFHQDPRYFYKGKGSIGSRTLYAISSAVIARGDDGRWKPNYSRVLGNFSAAAISNLYYPAADRGGSLVLLNGLAATGGDAFANLIREFILKRFTSHVPQGADGQP